MYNSEINLKQDSALQKYSAIYDFHQKRQSLMLNTSNQQLETFNPSFQTEIEEIATKNQKNIEKINLIRENSQAAFKQPKKSLQNPFGGIEIIEECTLSQDRIELPSLEDIHVEENIINSSEQRKKLKQKNEQSTDFNFEKKMQQYQENLTTTCPSKANYENQSTVANQNKIQIQKLDEQLSNGDFEFKDNELSFYVERRFCTICNVEQPLRTKHCKLCKRCIALYDHHCPWTGNCIGEKNRCLFYWFLFLQLTQIIFSGLKLYSERVRFFEYLAKHGWLSLAVLFSVILMLIFICLVILLLFYHTYLALVNMTTWENVSWQKISYLKEWPENVGSPFHQGIFSNLAFYCSSGCGNYLVNWMIPKAFYKKMMKRQKKQIAA